MPVANHYDILPYIIANHYDMLPYIIANHYDILIFCRLLTTMIFIFNLKSNLYIQFCLCTTILTSPPIFSNKFIVLLKNGGFPLENADFHVKLG